MHDILRLKWAVQAKTEIAKEVKDTLSKSMGSFGFMIIEALVWLSLFPNSPCLVYHILSTQRQLATHDSEDLHECT